MKLDPERPEYHRVHLNYLDNKIQVVSTGNQISSRLNSFVGANGLLILPSKKEIMDQKSSNKYKCFIIDKFL